jgi:hypothetical protein
MDPTNSIKFRANLRKRVAETLAMIKEELGEESIFFDIEGIAHKEFVLAGKNSQFCILLLLFAATA